MVNEQRAMVAMSARTDLELAASAEEGQLNCRNVPFHVDPQAALWSREGGQLTAASCLQHHPAVVRPRAASTIPFRRRSDLSLGPRHVAIRAFSARSAR